MESSHEDCHETERALRQELREFRTILGAILLEFEGNQIEVADRLLLSLSPNAKVNIIKKPHTNSTIIRLRG